MEDVPYGTPGEAERELTAVRAAFAAFARRDVAAALALTAPDVELHLRATAELAGRDEPYRGHDGVRAYFADLARVWHALELHADDWRATPSAVVVFGRVHGRRGEEIVARRAMWTWTLRDGLTCSVRANDMGPVPSGGELESDGVGEQPTPQ